MRTGSNSVTMGRPVGCRGGGWAALLVLAFGAGAQPVAGWAQAQGSNLLAAPGAAAWVPALLPAQKLPPTRLEVRAIEGRPAWRVQAEGSYGNLVHALQGAGSQARELAWRWQLERAIERADLKTKAGDDAALKVCVLFDLPTERVPFVERHMLRLARATSGQALPAATLCYVWAPLASGGSVLPNAHTRRMRWMVLRGAESPLGVWHTEQRDLQADFLRAFGEETPTVPPLMAVLVGADADNTGGRGLGWLQDLALRP